MSTTAHLKLETIQQTGLIIGENHNLVSALQVRLQSAGVQTFSAISQLNQLPELDYLLVVPPLPTSQLDSILNLYQTYKPRTYLVVHPAQVETISSSLTGLPKIFYGDYLAKESLVAPTLENYLTSAHNSHSLILPGDGLQPYHLLTQQDLIEGIYSLLTTQPTQKDQLLVGEGSISLLSLAYQIRTTLNQSLSLTFDKDQIWSDPSLAISASPRFLKSNFQALLPLAIAHYKPTSPPLATLPSQPHLTKLAELEHATLTPTPVSGYLEQPVFVPSRSHKRKLSFPKLSFPKPTHSIPVKIIGAGLVIAISLYLSLIIASLTLTLLTLKNYQTLLTTNTLPPTSSLSVAKIPATFLEANLVSLNALTRASSTTISSLTSLATTYRHSLDILLLAHDLTDTTSELLSYVLGGGGSEPTSLISLARLQSDELYEALSLLDGSLPTISPTIIPAKYHDSYHNLKLALSTIRKHTLTAKSLFSIAPDLLGVGDRRKYLVLFQNNMELRPTGGFIGSFAIISLENGVLYDMPIYDVYSADGQLKGHVEPPAELKEYLGEANWYLRDSNWDPDFPTSARRAEWFLNKTLGIEVQGTLAINVYTLADLLDAVGPLTLPDYQEQVSSANIFERAEYYSEVNFFPGSTQKKEFLSSVADALFAKLSEVDGAQSYLLAHALALSLDEKNTLFALDSKIASHTLNVLGWDGELRSEPCPAIDGSCLADYAMLVDSNLGVNKANYFLRRSLQLNLTIDKDRALSHKLGVTYQNTSTSTAWPAGIYKSYSRLYLPIQTKLDSISIDSKPLSSDKITLSKEHDRLVVGYPLEVPVNSTVKVEYAYHSTIKLSDSSPLYSFYWQKQPGTSEDPLRIYLNYPLFLEPELVSPQAALNSQQLEFVLSNTTDRRITVKFR